MFFLELLDQLEQEANGLFMSLNSKPHVAAIVLNHLNVDELVTEALNDTKEGALHEDFLCNLIQAELLLEDLVRQSFLVFIAVQLLVEMEDRFNYNSWDLNCC